MPSAFSAKAEIEKLKDMTRARTKDMILRSFMGEASLSETAKMLKAYF